ncbi:unnamed protein product [Protopolystoma xenopodis]|uniref:Uncharacterized protein n=1 Tax=Protopolystoma xenopodis TaxID=117903 RepID=A0A448XGL4_9PLAT|nr:unnamed protein product [Protopolystoma xenopodis]
MHVSPHQISNLVHTDSVSPIDSSHTSLDSFHSGNFTTSSLSRQSRSSIEPDHGANDLALNNIQHRSLPFNAASGPTPHSASSDTLLYQMTGQYLGRTDVSDHLTSEINPNGGYSNTDDQCRSARALLGLTSVVKSDWSIEDSPVSPQTNRISNACSGLSVGLMRLRSTSAVNGSLVTTPLSPSPNGCPHPSSPSLHTTSCTGSPTLAYPCSASPSHLSTSSSSHFGLSDSSSHLVQNQYSQQEVIQSHSSSHPASGYSTCISTSVSTSRLNQLSPAESPILPSIPNSLVAAAAAAVASAASAMTTSCAPTPQSPPPLVSLSSPTAVTNTTPTSVVAVSSLSAGILLTSSRHGLPNPVYEVPPHSSSGNSLISSVQQSLSPLYLFPGHTQSGTPTGQTLFSSCRSEETRRDRCLSSTLLSAATATSVIGLGLTPTSTTLSSSSPTASPSSVSNSPSAFASPTLRLASPNHSHPQHYQHRRQLTPHSTACPSAPCSNSSPPLLSTSPSHSISPHSLAIDQTQHQAHTNHYPPQPQQQLPQPAHTPNIHHHNHNQNHHHFQHHHNQQEQQQQQLYQLASLYSQQGSTSPGYQAHLSHHQNLNGYHYQSVRDNHLSTSSAASAQPSTVWDWSATLR